MLRIIHITAKNKNGEKLKKYSGIRSITTQNLSIGLLKSTSVTAWITNKASTILLRLGQRNLKLFMESLVIMKELVSV